MCTLWADNLFLRFPAKVFYGSCMKPKCLMTFLPVSTAGVGLWNFWTFLPVLTAGGETIFDESELELWKICLNYCYQYSNTNFECLTCTNRLFMLNFRLFLETFTNRRKDHRKPANLHLTKLVKIWSNFSIWSPCLKSNHFDEIGNSFVLLKLWRNEHVSTKKN